MGFFKEIAAPRAHTRLARPRCMQIAQVPSGEGPALRVFRVSCHQTQMGQHRAA